MRRFFAQRYTLFSRFDRGIQLDDEMWFSVTPEPIAIEQALVAAAGSGAGVVIDGFCGAGGNTIQLARAGGHFAVGLDIRPDRVRQAWRHAALYGQRRRCDFVVADFRSAPRLFRRADGVFLSPPWADGGLLPSPGSLSVRRLAGGLDGAALLQAALAISRNVAFFLPRDVCGRDLRALAVLADSDIRVQEHVKSVQYSPARRATAVTCYFGSWAGPPRAR